MPSFLSSYILYKEKPFSGKIRLVRSSENELIKSNSHLLVIGFEKSRYTRSNNWDFYNDKYDNLFIFLKLTFPMLIKFYEKEISTIDLEYDNNSINSIVTFKKNKFIVAQIPYKKSEVNGTVKLYEYSIYRKDSKENHFLFEEINYVNNQKNGKSFTFNSRGDTVIYCNYKDNQIVGEYLAIDTLYSDFCVTGVQISKMYYKDYSGKGKLQHFDKYKRLKDQFIYENGELNGLATLYDTNGVLYQSANFLNGKLHDSVISYNSDGSYKKIMLFSNDEFLKELDFENGILINEFVNDKTIKTDYSEIGRNRIEKDNLSFYTENRIKKGNKSEYIVNINHKAGYQKFYALDGTITKKGLIFKDQKIGLWEYNYPLLSEKYSIFYKDSIIKMDTIEFKSKGVYSQYDSNKVLISKRYLINEENLYNCGANEIVIISLYIVVYEKDSSFHLRNGFIKSYYPSGVIQSEGSNINGLPNGIWKFYNDNGSLREMGFFKNGKKQGKWLSGDLSKIHYNGDICLDMDTENIELIINELESKLKIKESFFINGLLISSSSLILSKN